MEYFVAKDSIVRQVWGNGDTILFIFAGSAAEFALNKAVDWLYFTRQLPNDPIGRLFSTVSYARQIIFSDKEGALKAINKIMMIHTAVENQRGGKIPDWAYRDVLFMLIHYSIAAFELLQRKLTPGEKQELYEVFYRLGKEMHIEELPEDYLQWLPVREQHLENDLARSAFTDDLYKQYKKHLGSFRFKIFIEGQKLVVPEKVSRLLNLSQPSLLPPLLFIYKLSRKINLNWLIKAAVLPAKYRAEIKSLDMIPA
jgi:hypothetical protein